MLVSKFNNVVLKCFDVEIVGAAADRLQETCTTGVIQTRSGNVSFDFVSVLCVCVEL